MYGGAHLFTPGVAAKLGKVALASLDKNGPFLGIDTAVMARVRWKLETEPIEDFRIDFEDGYGNRPAEEEDRHAEAAAKAMAEGMKDGILPPFIGIRIKPIAQKYQGRGFRTLEIFLTTLLQHSAGALPPNFVITLPKVEGPREPAALVDMLNGLETKLYLKGGPLKFEFLVETPQALLSLPQILDASAGRAVGAHFGAYDYLASLDIGAIRQNLLHPACDFARHMMKAALSNRGITLADGVTNTLPIGTREEVQLGWQTHYANVRHALDQGFYQGWDVHPAQLVSRYAAVFTFFREGWKESALRLRNFQAASEQTAVTGTVFDDLASVRGLRAYLDRAVGCGALSETEIGSLS
jgi:citrate lyase beta subunit